jgi:hypothetical protein
MAAPSEEKLICDKFNLEALTVNQVKSFKSLADGKDVFIGTKTGSGIFAYISSITCAPCKTSSDWIRVLVAVTNEILKRESSKCILDLPRVEARDVNSGCRVHHTILSKQLKAMVEKSPLFMK